MDNIRIGTVLGQRDCEEWIASALAQTFTLVPCTPDQVEVVSGVDILLFDMATAAQYRHWLDLFRRHLAPDSPQSSCCRLTQPCRTGPPSISMASSR